MARTNKTRKRTALRLHERLAEKPLEKEDFKGLPYLSCKICITEVTCDANYFDDHSGPYCSECKEALLIAVGAVLDEEEEEEDEEDAEE